MDTNMILYEPVKNAVIDIDHNCTTMSISVLTMQFIVTNIILFQGEIVVQFRLNYGKYIHVQICN